MLVTRNQIFGLERLDVGDVDTVVYPKESEWFQELTEFMQVEPLEKNAFYQSGLIGFKELNEEDFVQFISIVRDHLDFSDLDTTNNQHLCPIPTL